MVIDSLVLLGENRFGPSLMPDTALAVAAAEGVDRLLVAPARPAGYHLEPANDAVAEACRRADGRLSLLGRVDPLNGDHGAEEARRCIDDLGARGLMLHPGEECFPIARAVAVMEVAADRGVPVVVATGYYGVSEPLQVAEVATMFPTVPVLMTTGGQINISGLSMADAWTALLHVTNLHVMTNGEYRQDFIEQLATDLPDRALYASFAPTFDQRFERRRIRSARMDGAARAALEHGNAARVFGLT